ncbi:GLPGLI family protein [Salegentibacter sp. LM13S]|uniref:GLPGLI family protein n=1 Tax=Salegentibacter lacus TaxID=2873599 RepID=UPI001CCAF9EB|nr:GLPGLI family protein [Salegentibacter lacus]MBZ9632375.1 GLPGLI family protein [Salegentibacter lacus]
MKHVYLSFILLLISPIFNAQELTEKFQYKATYDLTWQIDSTNVESIQEETMVLYRGDNISRFTSENFLKHDSINELRKKNFEKTGRFMAPPQTKFKYKLFKNFPEGRLYFFEKIARDRFKYTEQLPLQEWEIHPETKEISGYNVQKATTTFSGRDYIAWFTSEIPISDGPYKFSGLPGLIIEIADTKNYYHFKLSGFKEIETEATVSIDEDRYTKVSKNDFLTAQESYTRDPLGTLSKAGITIGWSEQEEKSAKKELKENYKSRNNPIELQ